MDLPAPTTATAQLHATDYNALVASNTASNIPESYTPLSTDSILFFCMKQMRDMDTKIFSAMTDQQNQVKMQDSMAAVQQALKASHVGSNPDNTAFTDPVAIANANAAIDAAYKLAEKSGNTDVMTTLATAKHTLNQGADAGGTDSTVTNDELKSMTDAVDSSLSSLRSGAEMSMINLQALVAKRATQLQLSTGMMNSLNEGLKAVAGNVGR